MPSDGDMSHCSVLQVANLGDPKAAIETIQTKGISSSQMDVVDYPGPGYCVFMQGSKIAHSVTAVTKANEPRLTVVKSLSHCCVLCLTALYFQCTLPHCCVLCLTALSLWDLI